jgi:hypothetical protein
MSEWADMFTRADGSHMTQMDVDGGRVLTIRAVEVVAYDKKQRTALVHWQEDVLPWLMPQQEGLLLAAIGWRPQEAVGRRLLLNRDPTVRFGPDIVGGSRIYGSPDLDRDLVVRWRCGKRKLSRELVRCPDPDPLWGLVVVQWRLELAAVDAWALDKGMAAAPSTLTGEARHKVAARLDTADNHAAIVAFMGKDK